MTRSRRKAPGCRPPASTRSASATKRKSRRAPRRRPSGMRRWPRGRDKASDERGRRSAHRRHRAPDHPDILNRKRLIGPNRWPADMPEFRAATMEYYAAMERMTTRLVPVFALALDLPEDYFAEVFAQPNCTIRLIHYPAQPDPG